MSWKTQASSSISQGLWSDAVMLIGLPTYWKVVTTDHSCLPWISGWWNDCPSWPFDWTRAICLKKTNLSERAYLLMGHVNLSTSAMLHWGGYEQTEQMSIGRYRNSIRTDPFTFPSLCLIPKVQQKLLARLKNLGISDDFSQLTGLCLTEFSSDVGMSFLKQMRSLKRLCLIDVNSNDWNPDQVALNQSVLPSLTELTIEIQNDGRKWIQNTCTLSKLEVLGLHMYCHQAQTHYSSRLSKFRSLGLFWLFCSVWTHGSKDHRNTIKGLAFLNSSSPNWTTPSIPPTTTAFITTLQQTINWPCCCSSWVIIRSISSSASTCPMSLTIFSGSLVKPSEKLYRCRWLDKETITQHWCMRQNTWSDFFHLQGRQSFEHKANIQQWRLDWSLFQRHNPQLIDSLQLARQKYLVACRANDVSHKDIDLHRSK